VVVWYGSAILLTPVVATHCGKQNCEKMPTDACLFFYDCILFLRIGEVPPNPG
jgi:hypothetical protein